MFDNIQNLSILLNNSIATLSTHLKIDLKPSTRGQLPASIPLQNITSLKIEYWKTCIALSTSLKSSKLCSTFLHEFTNEAFDLLYNLFSLILYSDVDGSTDLNENKKSETDNPLVDNLEEVNRDVDRTDVYQESSDDCILELFNLKQLIDGYYSKGHDSSLEDGCELVKNSSVKKKLAVIFELVLCCYLHITEEDVELGKCRCTIY